MSRVVRQMPDDGRIEYTVPEKLNSRFPQYRLTPEGGALTSGAA